MLAGRRDENVASPPDDLVSRRHHDLISSRPAELDSNRQGELIPSQRDGLLLAGGLGAWALLVYLLTSRGIPDALLGAVGIDRGHMVLWQVVHSLFWATLALAAFLVWRQISDRPRFNRYLVALAVLAGFFQVALLMIAGLAFGFGESPYAHAILPMSANILYILTVLVAVEMCRACMVVLIARRSATLALATATVFFAFIGLSLAKLTTVDGPESLTTLVGEQALPGLSEGLLASFLALVGGPLAAIAYRGVLVAFEWLSPILPSLSWQVTAFVGTMAPVIGLWIIQQPVLEQTVEEEMARLQEGEPAGRSRRIGWLGVAVIAVTLVWFTTGMFGVQPVVVSGPSMNPALEVGDVVVVRDARPGDIDVGDIIQFRQGGLPVIHRVVAIDDGGSQIVFITRGDNNNADDDPVLASNLDGEVVLVIPKAGWPSIYLQKLIGGIA